MSDTRTRGYKFALRPRKGQAKRMRQWCSAARYAWNWTLAQYELALDETRASWKMAKEGETVPSVRDLLEARLSSSGLQVSRRGKGTLPLNSILYKLWCHHRDTEAPQWVREATVAKALGGHSQVASYPVERLAFTINQWWKAKRRAPWYTDSERKAGKRRRKPPKDEGSDGRVTGPPRYKRYGVNPSFTVQIGKGRQAYAKNALLIPVFGRVYVADRLHQNPLDIIPEDGVAVRVTVREVAGEWEGSVSVTEPWMAPGKENRSLVCGIDLGVNAVATIAWSDGRIERIEPPRPLQRLGIGIQLLKRRLSVSRHVLRCKDCAGEIPLTLKKRAKRPRKCRACGGRLRKWRSNRGMRLKLRSSKLQARVARIRKDHLHKLTHKILQDAAAVCTEPHNVTGLVSAGVAQRCAKLWNKDEVRKAIRKSMLDIGWGELRRQLEYKAKWLGLDYVTLPEGTASDKTCHACGERNEVPNNTSDYTCVQCGWTGTRQENTALLCLHYIQVSEGSPSDGRAVTRQRNAQTARAKARPSTRGSGVHGSMDETTPGASAPGGTRKNARKTQGSPRQKPRAGTRRAKPPKAPVEGQEEQPSQH